MWEDQVESQVKIKLISVFKYKFVVHVLYFSVSNLGYFKPVVFFL